MPVLVLGLNHRTAPVGLLERVAVPAERLGKALYDLCGRSEIDEAVVVSTCNRVEVYAHVGRYHAGMAEVRDFLSAWAGIAPEDLLDHTYDYHDEQAAAHLFAVASGLDSMVVGERQIHLQVKQALLDAEHERAAGRVLASLFRHALRVGRRTRVETAISDGAASMVDVGLAAVEQVLGTLEGRTVLIVGAGKMGGMAGRRLVGSAGRIMVTNRTREKAEWLAASVGGEVLEGTALRDGLAVADLVLSSTGSPSPLIGHELVDAVMRERPGRPLVCLDLAVPRDVDPACNGVPAVTVLDVDAVRELTDTGRTGREVATARGIVAEEAARFAGWTRTVRVEPTIAALRDRAERVRAGELDRLAGRLASLDDRQRDAVEALTRGIVNTLLHEPTVQLKRIADARGGELHARALRELFDLD